MIVGASTTSVCRSVDQCVCRMPGVDHLMCVDHTTSSSTAGLIGLFAPPEELSAGAVLGCFEFYALAHQADFDVCWCKGSVAERIFKPLMERIRKAGGSIMGAKAVTDIKVRRL